MSITLFYGETIFIKSCRQTNEHRIKHVLKGTNDILRVRIGNDIHSLLLSLTSEYVAHGSELLVSIIHLLHLIIEFMK